MYFKSVLFAVLITTVKCDCDATFLKCLGEFVFNMFGTNATAVNSEVPNINDTNTNIFYFDINENDFLNDTENIFNNISQVVKQDIKNKGLFESELNITKFIDETSKIFLNIFDLKNIQNLFTPKEKEIITSEIERIVNEKNLTMESIGELLDEINRDIEVKVNKTKSKIDQEIDTIFNDFAKQFDFNNTQNNHAVGKDTEQVKQRKNLEKTELSFRSSIELALRTQLNEISDSSFDNNYYDTTDDNNSTILSDSTDYPIIDYVELYKDTTNEDVIGTPDGNEVTTNIAINTEEENTVEASCHGNANATSVSSLVHPWIAAIFVKNATTQQFDYVCDGAVLTERIVVTGARCLQTGNTTLEARNVLIILGKTSLQSSGSNERVYRIKSLKLHDNYTRKDEHLQNDIATLRTEEVIDLNDKVQTACLVHKSMKKEPVVDAITTGWKITGELTTIHFDVKSYGICKDMKNKDENVFCASYGNDIKDCPSYGGLNVVKLSNGQWFLSGIRSDAITDREFCTERNLVYTDMEKYSDWIYV